MTDNRRFAAAKVNLALHVTGRAGNGYHMLDSLVCFADVGDVVSVAPAADLELNLCGPMAGLLPSGADNLVLKAARLLAPAPGEGARITLDKRLPVAAGIGGGSADAAACLSLLAGLWHRPLPSPATLMRLGADLPVCIEGRAVRMEGMGETLTALPDMPDFFAVLVNPGAGLSTAQVFRALIAHANTPLAPLPQGSDPARWTEFLSRSRNDLEAPAIRLMPEIADVLRALRAGKGCVLARMSGSGATCFGLYDSAEDANGAAHTLGQQHPRWWVRATRLGSAPERVEPDAGMGDG